MSNQITTKIIQDSTSIANWTIPIQKWAIWQDDIDQHATPDVCFIDANSRRKLSRFAKMALKVAHDCSDDVPQAHFVFASQHGDIVRTTEMLLDLARQEELSPTVFSMSVLNACAGMYSIAKQDHSPSTAISAGPSSFGYGLLEGAFHYLNHPDIPVIYVYVDEVPPSIYGLNTHSPSGAHAIGILIANRSEKTLCCQMSASTQVGTSSIPQSTAFIDGLVHQQSAHWESEGVRWDWAYSES
jgi:hypothetical protein